MSPNAASVCEGFLIVLALLLLGIKYGASLERILLFVLAVFDWFLLFVFVLQEF